MKAARHSKSATDAMRSDAPARIIEAATRLFASRGFEGTSTKEICSAAGVNIAAINYHFESKEGLYRHIIASFGGARVAVVERILTDPDTPEELRVRLGMFLCESLEVCVNQPHLCRIVQSEIELLHERTAKVFRDTFVKLFDTLAAFLESAQRKGFLRSDIDPRICAHILFNQVRQLTRGHSVNSKYFGLSIQDESVRRALVTQVITVFLEGVGASERAPAKVKSKKRNA